MSDPSGGPAFFLLFAVNTFGSNVSDLDYITSDWESMMFALV